MKKKELIDHCHEFMNVKHSYCAFCPRLAECDTFENTHKFPPRMYLDTEEYTDDEIETKGVKPTW
jgi:hypothetical protein